MIIESVKWVEADEILEFYKILPEWLEELKLVNRNLLIALSCISFCIIPATFYSAFNVGKDFRWDAYKKIGGNIKIQGNHFFFFCCCCINQKFLSPPPTHASLLYRNVSHCPMAFSSAKN